MSFRSLVSIGALVSAISMPIVAQVISNGATPVTTPHANNSNPPEELQREKIQLEIQELQRPWWKKQAYIAAWVPALLGALTLFAGYKTGYFNARHERLTIEKANLDRDIKEFTNRKDLLESEVAHLKEKLILAPLEADIDRIIELTSNRPNVLNVQKMVNAALGGPHPELYAPFDRILTALSTEDPYHVKRTKVLAEALEKQDTESTLKKCYARRLKGTT